MTVSHLRPCSGLQCRGITLVLLLLGVMPLFAACNRDHEFFGIVYNPPIVAPALNGIDQNGKPFSLDQAAGYVTLVYFGYTNCPDVCPLTMGQIATVYRQLGEDAKEVRVIFVSTDPDRDTPSTLAQFVSLFDASFWGIQIPQDELSKVLAAYGGLAEKDKIPEGKSADQYSITHSNWVYAIDRAGNLRLVFSSQLQSQQIVDDLKYLLAE